MYKTLLIISMLAVALVAGSALAQDGTWTNSAAGSWSGTGNWLGGIVADGTNNTATLSAALVANRIITLDTPRTIGSILAQTTGSYNFTIGATTNVLTLAVNSGDSQLSALAGRTLTISSPVVIMNGIHDTGAGNVTFTAPITLSSDQTWINTAEGSLLTGNGLNCIDNNGYNLTLTNTATITLGVVGTYAPAIKGSGNLIIDGQGRCNIGGTNTAFTGTVTINEGVVQVSNMANALGAGNLKLNGGILSFYWGTTYSRTLGTGNNQVQVLGAYSGFAGAGTTDPTINLGSTVVWGALGEGAATGYFNPDIFVLGDPETANNGSVTFGSVIDFNGATRNIVFARGTGTSGNVATLTGTITNSVGVAGMIKSGNGVMRMLNVGIYLNDTIAIQEGIIRFAGTARVAGTTPVTVSSGATLHYNNNNNVTQSHPVTGAGMWLKSGTGILTLDGVVSTDIVMIYNTTSNATHRVIANQLGVLQCKNLYLGAYGALRIATNNVISDRTDLYISTAARASIRAIDFTTVAGAVESIDELFIDGVKQPKGTYGATGSGATYTNDLIFGNTNGVINVLNKQADAIVVSGKIVTGVGGAVCITPPWTPAAVATLAWYDASDNSTIRSSANLVSQWKDKSGNGHDFWQLTGALQPTEWARTVNGLRVLDFNGDNMAMTNNPFGSVISNASVFVVFERDRTQGSWEGLLFMNGIASTNDWEFKFWSWDTPDAMFYFISGNTSDQIRRVTQSTTNGAHMLNCYDYPLTDLKEIRLDGAIVTDSLTSAQASWASRGVSLVDGLPILCTGSGSLPTFDGAIAEVIMFDTVVSDTDRYKLEGYLAWKWGFVTDLPSNHPYKNRRP